jgi:hypothetical protein
MKDGAFFDTLLGIVVGLYFTSQDRFFEFHQLIVDRLADDAPQVGTLT